MNNEKYINHYIEVLTGTMSDAIIRNISLQANVKVSDEVIQELTSRVEELSVLCANQNQIIDELRNTSSEKENNFNTEISSLNRMKTEYENMKSLATNVEIYRNELIREREEHQKTRFDSEKAINELKDKITELTTPQKKKKVTKVATTVAPIGNENSPDLIEVMEKNIMTDNTETTFKDGGTF